MGDPRQIEIWTWAIRRVAEAIKRDPRRRANSDWGSRGLKIRFNIPASDSLKGQQLSHRSLHQDVQFKTEKLPTLQLLEMANKVICYLLLITVSRSSCFNVWEAIRPLTTRSDDFLQSLQGGAEGQESFVVNAKKTFDLDMEAEGQLSFKILWFWKQQFPFRDCHPSLLIL